MPCPSLDAMTTSAAATAAKMSRGAAASKKPSRPSSSSSSWLTRSMGFYYPLSTTSSGKSRAQSKQSAAPEGARDGNNTTNSDKQSSGAAVNIKKKRSISIGRSITCSSICSTKESSVKSRDHDRGAGRSASSRSLRAPDLDVDAVYASGSAAISATSSFNSDTTTAATTVVTTTTSPLSSALSSPLSSVASSFRGVHQIRKLSGCYQCHSVFDPSSFAAAFPCADCGEVFHKAESLELHRATRHAVSELGPEDTSRNIVEIIFQSSWLRKQAPVCSIERILKVQSSERTVKRFEQYKESIRERASADQGQGKKNPRCVADGNELLRFYSTTFTCSLGVAGSTALCRAPSAAPCNLCSIIRDGFRVDGDGKIATVATSGRAHDMAQGFPDSDKRAMLVCRVVAGRVKKATSDEKSSEEDDCDFDSVSPSTEAVYSDLDELFVFNPRAILPCFVVIYSGY